MASQQRAQKCADSARGSARITSICYRRIAWAGCVVLLLLLLWLLLLLPTVRVDEESIVFPGIAGSR